MKTASWVFSILVLLLVVITPVSATAFSAWSLSNGCWTATNDTHTLVMINTTGASSYTFPSGVNFADVLQVAGGAGGGDGGNGGGGGGAGGLVITNGVYVGGKTAFVAVGTKGFGGNTSGAAGSPGLPTTVLIASNTTTATGGGRGGGNPDAPGNGGSGGGSYNGGAAGTGIAGQGQNGGVGTVTGPGYPAGGGGGNQTPGMAGSGGTIGGDGGEGFPSANYNLVRNISCGGGGGVIGTVGVTGGSGHSCGGDGGAGTNGGDANSDSPGSGGGGGGSPDGSATRAGGNGSNGVVIFKYVTPPSITANFIASPSLGVEPLFVTFTDTSTGTAKIDSWEWTFGDIGAGNTSALQNPTHTYNSAGTYTVNMTITNTTFSLLSIKFGTVTVNSTVHADFVGAPTSGFVPHTVTFADLSTGSALYAWNWSFGDGNYSIVRNPVHTYVSPGAFTVSLNVTGPDGFNITTVSPYINVAASSAFVGSPNFATTYAMETRFTDLYPTGHLTWNWSFGDTYFNLTQNPRHYYSVAGLYNVTLNTTTSAYGINITTVNNYINLTSDLPNVKSWMHMNGSVGGTVFTDQAGNAWTSTFVTTQSSQKKFGFSSALFNSASSSLRTVTSPQFNFGTSNFTIEQWVNLSSSGSGQFIISRTTNAATRVDGWGLYHSTASAASDAWVFWLGNAATGSTGTFTIPLKQWNHVVIQRIQPQGDVIVSVNGVAVAYATGLTGNYDTSNGVAYGNPISGGAVSSAQMFLDETRISDTGRWTTSSGGSMLFSVPVTEYQGDLFPIFADPNPGSVLRFKTNPSIPSAASIANGTLRQRTTQIQNVNITNNISVTEIFPATHIFIKGVTANSTTYSGINFTYVNIDNVNGILLVNLTRPGGFSTTGLTESRASIFDSATNYYNYTLPNDPDYNQDIQYFGNGFLGNLTAGLFFPVTNFIATNVTYLDWVTYSNFTITPNNPIAGETAVTFIPNNNWSANQFDWDFGDGSTIINSTSGLQTHVYAAPGNYTVSLRSYLYQNGSVTNSTTLLGGVFAVYNTSYVSAEFTGTPTSGSPGLNVAFTDLSVFGASNATSGRTYNWSFGDTGFTLMPYSSTQGNVNHVYTNLGTFTVSLTVNNTLNSSTRVKTNYITISTSQNANTWYTQRLVRLKALTSEGVPILGANISAVFLSTSLPNTSISWIQSAFGVTASVAQQMVDGSLLMSDITGGDGSTTFMMFPGIRYGITVQNTTSGLNFHTTILPNDNDYMIYCPGNPSFSQNTTQLQLANTSLFITEPNNSYVTFNIIYQDLSGITTNVRWNVTNWDNMTPMYYKDLGNPLTLPVTDSYTVPNIRGQQWKFWYNATRSGLA